MPNDARLSFNEAAEIYDQARPSYPRALYDALFALLPTSPLIVEVGPGTGQATQDLLARGAMVHAVEIGPAMAAKLQANCASERLQISVGDFETLHIEPSTGDAVFSATAYHWISTGAQLDRPAVILRRGGVISIVDLIQVDSRDDGGFFDAAQAIYERYGQGQGHRSPPAPTRQEVRPQMYEALESDPRYEAVSVSAVTTGTSRTRQPSTAD